jgi:hypothetical protein
MQTSMFSVEEAQRVQGSVLASAAHLSTQCFQGWANPVVASCKDAADLIGALLAEREAAQARIAELEWALRDVREEICTGPVNDVLWHNEIPSETTVDFICNTLNDDWDYDKWLEAREALEGKG